MLLFSYDTFQRGGVEPSLQSEVEESEINQRATSNGLPDL